MKCFALAAVLALFLSTATGETPSVTEFIRDASAEQLSDYLRSESNLLAESLPSRIDSATVIIGSTYSPSSRTSTLAMETTVELNAEMVKKWRSKTLLRQCSEDLVKAIIARGFNYEIALFTPTTKYVTVVSDSSCKQ